MNQVTFYRIKFILSRSLGNWTAMCLITNRLFHFRENDYNISFTDLSLFLGCLLDPICCCGIFSSNIQMDVTTLFSRNPRLRARPLSFTDYRRISSYWTGKTWKLDQWNRLIGCVTSTNCTFSAGSFVLVGQVLQ